MIKEMTIWMTSDNKTFYDKAEAEKHENMNSIGKDDLKYRYENIKRVDLNDISEIEPYVARDTNFAAWFYPETEEDMIVVDKYLRLTLWRQKVQYPSSASYINPKEWILVHNVGKELSYMSEMYFVDLKRDYEKQAEAITRLLGSKDKVISKR